MYRVFQSCIFLFVCMQAPLVAKHPSAEKATEETYKFSKPVHVNGVDFEVMAETVWRRPGTIYGVAATKIGLRISNRSDKELTFDLSDKLRFSLKSAVNTDLVYAPVPKRFFPRQLKVGAGQSETITLPTELFHTRIGHVCLGLKSDIGRNWLTGDVQPGKYRLSLAYENRQNGDKAWLGKVQTEALEVEVKLND